MILISANKLLYKHHFDADMYYFGTALYILQGFSRIIWRGIREYEHHFDADLIDIIDILTEPL